MLKEIAYSVLMLIGIVLTVWWAYKHRYCCGGCGGTLRKHDELEGWWQCERCGADVSGAK